MSSGKIAYKTKILAPHMVCTNYVELKLSFENIPIIIQNFPMGNFSIFVLFHKQITT